MGWTALLEWHRWRRCARVGVLLWWLGASAVTDATVLWHGVVTHVSDGDTVWVRPLGGGLAHKLRLQGIDAPERCQLWGPQASAALHVLLLSQVVQVQNLGHDTYGRTLAHVFYQGVDVGGWMVTHGLAWSYRFQGQPGPYDAEQAQAESLRRGLFSQGPALNPYAFRRLYGACP